MFLKSVTETVLTIVCVEVIWDLCIRPAGDWSAQMIADFHALRNIQIALQVPQGSFSFTIKPLSLAMMFAGRCTFLLVHFTFVVVGAEASTLLIPALWC